MLDLSKLADHFIVAMPNMTDSHFHRSVIYICEYGADGTIGLRVNHLSELTMGDIFRQMDIEPIDDLQVEVPVLTGGPVQPERGFVLHAASKVWESSLQIGSDIAVTTSVDIIEAIAKGEGPEQYLFILGYSGWEEEQLADELRMNAWLSCKAEPRILFDTPLVERYKAALATLGVNEKQLYSEPGHS